MLRWFACGLVRVTHHFHTQIFDVCACVPAGRRLEYGKEGKRPPWWPEDCPWDIHKPLSTMKHGEVTSVFKAM